MEEFSLAAVSVRYAPTASQQARGGSVEVSHHLETVSGGPPA